MVRRVLLITGALLFLTWIDVSWANEISDSDYAQRLIGTWWAREPHRHEEGVVVYGELEYSVDGTARAELLYHQKDASGRYQLVGRRLMIGRWKIEDGILITYDVKSLPRVPELDGWVSRDEILEIGEDKAVFKDLADGKTFERFRKTESGNAL
jgi:hypothetical protein